MGMVKTIKEIKRLNEEITAALDAIKWASDNMMPNIGKASSFGIEDAVVIDMMVKINPSFQFFTLDTGFLPKETFDIIKKVETKYGIKIEMLKPDKKQVEQMVESRGKYLFYESIKNRKLCCNARKVEPMNKKLNTLDGWITGLRRDQTENRKNMKMFELDGKHGNILKINPIINWNIKNVWSYVKKYDVPYNELLDNGYTSIGCDPCTRPTKPDEDPRAGRWWWESETKKECGLHL